MKYLIVGISGQDGKISQLISKETDNKIFGVSHNKKKVKNTFFWNGSSKDFNTILKKTNPDFVLNFAAIHNSSGQNPSQGNYKEMYDVNTARVLIILESILNFNKNIVYINSLSSHIYEKKDSDKINENSLMKPRNFYGLTKIHSLKISEFFSDEFGLKVLNLIMFNHESEFRSKDFATKHIADSLAKIYLGLENKIFLENKYSNEDFSDAYDFIRAIFYLTKNKKYGRYILSSGQLTSLENIIIKVAKKLNIENFDIISNESKNSIYGDNSKLLATNFKFESDIFNAVYRMTLKSIEDYET